MARILTVASGKGGAGKTSISLNLALALAGSGARVCLFDADLGLANVNILTGLYPKHSLAEVIQGRQALADIMIRNYNGIDMIPGSSGVAHLADMTGQQAGRLVREFLALSGYDYFILDTSAGISAQVLAFCRASHEMALVITPEPTSLTDAYSLLKVMAQKGPMPRVRVVVNQVKSARGAKKAYTQLRNTVQKFLGITLYPLGVVARDPKVSIAVASQVPFTLLFPDTPAACCIRSMAGKLAKDKAVPGDMPLELFWDQCLALLSPGRPDKPLAKAPGKARHIQEQTELAARLAGLEKRIGALLDEVAQIRSLISPPPGSPGCRPQTGPEASKRPQMPALVPARQGLPRQNLPLTLDFEAWVRQKRSGRNHIPN